MTKIWQKKIIIKTDEEDSLKKNIDSTVHMCNASYIINSKVIESLQTIEENINDFKVILCCKESTHIYNGMPSKYRKID